MSKCLPNIDIRAEVGYDFNFGRSFFLQCKKLRSFHCALPVIGGVSGKSIASLLSTKWSINTVLEGLNIDVCGLVLPGNLG